MDLYKGKYWNVVFWVWCQDYPGYCIIGCDKESLSVVEPEAWVELGKLEKELERVCKKLFGATMFNFACLMNNAYRDKEKPNVHYHFVPRYKNESKSFEDSIRNAISIGGDSDTIAAITGSIAAAYYGIPLRFIKKASSFFDERYDEDLINALCMFEKNILQKLSYSKK